MRLALGDGEPVAIDLIESCVECATVNTRQLQLRHDDMVRSADRTSFAVGDGSLDALLERCHSTSGL